MLRSTFQHLKGIGVKKEQEFWRLGILCWEDLMLRQETQLSIFSSHEDTTGLFKSFQALENEDSDFFAKHLIQKEHYRIALSFPSKTMFLDIETTGLSRYYDNITLVGWSMGAKYGVWVKGDGEEALRTALKEAKVVVTFNGSLFDLPFLRQEFQDLKIPKAHVDLRFLSRRVGLSGGQKVIEKNLGIKRPENLLDLAGEAAPLLWHKYRLGDLDSLRLLIAYNHADIEGMKQIFDYVIDCFQEQNKLPPCTSRYCFSAQRSGLKWINKKANEHTDGVKIYPYRGTPGPIVSLDKLISPSRLPHLRVVGIDLTGSEEKPSGWCLLKGHEAFTKRIGSDADLVYATLDATPHLVSIDSPLSLPVGRSIATDNDPGRKAYGITRHCERILKKRGINVYPCLIRSMQALTSRGIRLANHFRNLGIPVIESYPGAAQDIMNIPRKRASLEFLKNGLSEFGVTGEFVEQSVSHDELDAITSAIVGLFFFSRQFEALGNDQEGFLIIPSIGTSKVMMKQNKRKIIGFSGLIGSGKTTAGRFLESSGFHYGRFSLVLAEILRDRGIEPTRETLQKVGDEVNRNPGQRWLCQELVRKLPVYGNLVIDGLRFPEDHASLVEIFGLDFLHVHVRASRQSRLERYVSKGGSHEEFTKADSHPVEASITELSSLAHVVIDNCNSVESFLLEVGQFVDCQQPLKGEAITCL